MPNKKEKVKPDNLWRTSIEDAELNDDEWTVKVVMIEAAGCEQDRNYLSKFEACASQSIRFVIKNICKTETLFMVNQLGSENKGKDDESLLVFAEAQAFLKEKKAIPPDILALVIKYLIMNMKRDFLSIKSQRVVVKEEIIKESATMVRKEEVRGTVKGDTKKNSESQNNEQTMDEKKYNTYLRLRGEEWRDKVYIDDYPLDGPSLYVAITGFLEPHLPSCLIKIGIPLIAIVQVRIELPSLAELARTSTRQQTKRGQSQSDLLIIKSINFWDEMQLLRLKDESNTLRNTAFVVLSPPLVTGEKFSDAPEKIYDEISYLMYDLQDLTRQHIHYLDNLHVMHIPEETPNPILQQYYLNLSTLPLETTTLYSILDNILRTVSTDTGLDDIKIMPDIDTYEDDVFNNLCNTKINKKKYRVTQNIENAHCGDPIIIDFGDMYRYSTFHKNISLSDVIFSMLLGMPVNKLWQYFERLSEEKEAKVKYHINVLLSCLHRKDVEIADLNRLIHILAFRKLYNNRSCLKRLHLPDCTIINYKKKLFKRSRISEPLKTMNITSARNSARSKTSVHETDQDPSIETLDIEEEESGSSFQFIFECPDLSELVSAAEIVVKYPLYHMIEDFEYFEEFKDAISLQVLHYAFESFNCVDYKYCEVTDSLILMFYNSCNSNGISREEWRGHIATPICLQDFFDFVLDENFDWIQNEENVYYLGRESEMSCKSKEKNSLIMHNCIDPTNVGSELLMEGSLKHKDHILEQQQDMSNDATNTSLEKKINLSKHNNDILKEDRKSRTSRPSTGKSSKQTFLRTPTESNISYSEKLIPEKIFTAYDLSDRRIEAFGKNSTYFSKNGIKISTKYTSLLQTDIDYLSLNVVFDNGSNEFWMHKIVDENIGSDSQDYCESPRIITKHNISIYLKKQRFPFEDRNTIKTDNTSKPPTERNTPSEFTDEDITETCLHTLLLTWPNGLVTETVYDNKSFVISHVKQFYTSELTPVENECMRCVSTKGEVIIFKKDGQIDVLLPGAVILKITKCEIVKPIPPEPVQIEVKNEKQKKDKKGEKGLKKVKTSLPTTKSVTSVTQIEQDYNLIIEEYEIIHTSGLRQKWVRDNNFNIENLLMKTATDYCFGEIFTKRNDGTISFLNNEGNLITTYPDKTRIITSFIIDNHEVYPEWTVDEIEYFSFNDFLVNETTSAKTKKLLSENNVDMLNEMVDKKRNDGYVSVHIIYSVEHPYFTTVTINKANDSVSVYSPDDVCVTVNGDNTYDFQLDDVTSGRFNGENLIVRYEGCINCMHAKKDSCIITVNIKSEMEYFDGENYYVWLHMLESNDISMIVDEEGEIHVMEENQDSQTGNEHFDRPREEGACTNETKSMKFFILNRYFTIIFLIIIILLAAVSVYYLFY